MTAREGQQLGNYRLLRLLGTGGFADVYLGEHVYLATQAAIKVLQTRLGADERERFLNEARIVAHLTHPHIVRVLEFGIEEDLPFLVMDYAPNGNLRQRLPRGIPLSAAQVVPYVEQVASALDYAHAQHLIHRDVKPENMLLGGAGELLLSDFGIAVITHSSHFQDTQEIFGTATYMAPEQIQGKAQPASDQYALGVVMYEWLCGDVPFHGSFTELCSQHLFAPLPTLREKVSGISPAVEFVVERALAKDPSLRFPDVMEMAQAFSEAAQLEQPASAEGELTVRRQAQPALLANVDAAYLPTRYPEEKNALSKLPDNASPVSPIPATQAVSMTTPELPVLPVPPPAIPQEKRGISRRNMILGGAGLVGLAAVGGMIWGILAHQAPPAPGPVTVKNFTTPPSPTPSTSTQSQGTTLLTYRGHTRAVYALAWSPNGEYLVSGGADSTAQVWNAPTGKTLYTYRGQVGLLLSVYSVGWSPNGQRIASGGTDTTVQVWDAASGNHALVYRGHSGRVLAVSWSPDAQFIASGGEDKTVQVWEEAGGTLVFTYHGHTNSIYAVSWSPDGRYIASAGADRTVQVWEASTGTPVITYHGHTGTVYALTWSPDGRYIASAGADRTVQVWEALTGKHLYTYHGHTGLGNVVSAVAWSPDGKRIVSGSTDKTAQVWDALSGAHVYVYKKHSGTVFVVKWAPDGQVIASGSEDATVQLWHA